MTQRKKPKLPKGIRDPKGAERRTREYVEDIARGMKRSYVRKG